MVLEVFNDNRPSYISCSSAWTGSSTILM